MNLEDKIERLTDSILQLNDSVTTLNAVIPTLATKEEVYDINSDMLQVKAMVNENRISINRSQWILTAIVSTLTFIAGILIPFFI